MFLLDRGSKKKAPSGSRPSRCFPEGKEAVNNVPCFQGFCVCNLRYESFFASPGEHYSPLSRVQPVYRQFSLIPTAVSAIIHSTGISDVPLLPPDDRSPGPLRRTAAHCLPHTLLYAPHGPRFPPRIKKMLWRMCFLNESAWGYPEGDRETRPAACRNHEFPAKAWPLLTRAPFLLDCGASVSDVLARPRA